MAHIAQEVFFENGFCYAIESACVFICCSSWLSSLRAAARAATKQRQTKLRRWGGDCMDTDRSVPRGTDCMTAAKSFIGLFEGHKRRRSCANSVPFRSICRRSIMESNEKEISYHRRSCALLSLHSS